MGINMTQEERKLLLKDLCARLPYGVKCLVNYTFCNETTDYEDVKSSDVDTLITINQQSEDYFFERLSQWFDVDEFKPYLFPLSSMTEEQRNIISNKIREIQINNPPFGKIHDSGTDNLLNNITLCAQWLINYYIENHFDYNGLIEKGLAIDATELNIY
jgi:hypothetical protein